MDEPSSIDNSRRRRLIHVTAFHRYPSGNVARINISLILMYLNGVVTSRIFHSNELVVFKRATIASSYTIKI